MKHILKSILALSAVFALASCNVDNIGTLYQHEGADAGVSFVQSALSDTEVSAATTQFVITLGRAVSDGAQTVNIESNLPAGIVVPSSVTFEAGQGAADLVLDISGMAVGKSYKGTISLANASDYNDLAVSSVSVTLQKAYTWLPYGTVTITDDLVTSAFGVDNVSWQVLAEKAESFEVYRILDPYGENYPYNDPGDFTPGAKLVVDCTDPNAVTFDRTNLGFNWGYGEFNAWVTAPGKIVNKVITFPVNGISFNLPDYGTFTANGSGLFTIDLNL